MLVDMRSELTVTGTTSDLTEDWRSVDRETGDCAPLGSWYSQYRVQRTSVQETNKLQRNMFPFSFQQYHIMALIMQERSKNCLFHSESYLRETNNPWLKNIL